MSTVSNITANLVTTLRAINGVNPYANRMKAEQVEGRGSDLDEVGDDAFPHFNVVLQSENRTREPMRNYVVLDYQIACTFMDPEEGEVESWLSDVEKSLTIDIRRGGNAHETFVTSIQRDSEVFDEIQVYIMNVEIKTLTEYGAR